jgi:broad specificity phosphatase PhoE
MNTLYMVRHGENRANITKEFSWKRVDYPLNEKGILQAQQAAEALVGKGIQAIYSSPLKRARQTARIIADKLKLPVTIVEDFRELNVGDLENRAPNLENWTIHNAVLHNWINGKLEERFPDGEDYHTLLRRLRSGLKQVFDGKDGVTALVVGHGGMFTLTLPDLCPDVRMDMLEGENHNCSITRIDLEMPSGIPQGKLVTWAAVDHLYGKAAELVPGAPQEGELAE